MEYLPTFSESTFIFHTAKIELPTLTFSQVVEVLEAGFAAGLADIDTQVVINLKRAWDYLFDNIHAPLDWYTIADYNRIIGSGIMTLPGYMRTSHVRITGTSYLPDLPNLSNITNDLEQAYAEENPIRRALIRFALICRGQWFSDGNKRTAALVANHSLIQENSGVFLLEEESISLGTFQDELLSYYESNDLESFISWLSLHAIKQQN